MKVHMLQWALGAPDRVNLQEFEQGSTPDIPDHLAEMFFQAGYAESLEQCQYRKRQEASQREIEARRLREEQERREARTKAYEERARKDAEYNARRKEWHNDPHREYHDTIMGWLPSTAEEKLGLWEGANPEFVASARRTEIPPRQPVPAEKQNRFRF